MMKKVKNTQRRFGEAGEYVNAVVRIGGFWTRMLMTERAVDEGVMRAAKQPEDALPLSWAQRAENAVRRWVSAW